MTTPYDLAVLADSPVAYWPLAETSGTSAADLAGANTGAYGGGFTLNAVPPGRAMGAAVLLNGSTGLVSVPTSAALEITGSVTVEAWVRRTSGSDLRTIVTKPMPSNTSPFFDYELEQGRVAGNKFTFWVSVGSTPHQLDSATARSIGAWYHVAGVYNGADMRLYVNGLLDCTPLALTGAIRNDAQPLLIGSWILGNFRYPGAVSSVAVYDSALPAARVLAHYQAAGPSPYPVSAYPARPRPAAVQPNWRRGLLGYYPLAGNAQDAAGLRDGTASGTGTFATGPFGPQYTPAGGGISLGSVDAALGGAAEFTLVALTTVNSYAASAGLWARSKTGAGVDIVIFLDVNSGVYTQVGQAGTFPRATAPMPPLGQPVLVTGRLTRAGELSIWFGPYKVAAVSIPGATVPTGIGDPLGLGSFNGGSGFVWPGPIVAAGFWSRALSDSEVLALAADPFAPVRPAPVRLDLLAPPSPTSDPVPWLRGAAAAPRAARLSVTPASGWAPGLAEAADLLPWLRRAAAPAPPVPAPRALLAPWFPASAPAPDPLAWLLRPAPAPAPGAPPPAAARAGWRPDVAAGPAPPVRHALVRFWRGPEAHMPRLEDGEPAWATDTKSLWVGSASGNVRIGP